MLEMVMCQKKKSGPWKGNLDVGYYGLVPSSEFITGAALATAVGMTQGTVAAANDALGWFKFAYNKKTLYIPKKTFRSGVTWNGLYNAGLVYGDDTNGLFPTSTPTLQNKKVTIGGVTYRVRVMKFSVSDPAASSASTGSELYDLFLKIYKNGNNPQSGVWDIYTPVEIGITGNGSDNTGQFTHGMETISTDLTKGFLFNMSYPVGLLAFDKATLTPNSGWRPVLESI